MTGLNRFLCSPERNRLLLLLILGVVAFGVGFVWVEPASASRLILDDGYYYILAVFAAFMAYGSRVLIERRQVWIGWLRHPGLPLVVLAACTLFVLGCDPFVHKVLYNEFDIQATAYQMHVSKEVKIIVRAYDLGGVWTPLGGYLDKRPYFFPFLISLLHDLTGYRLANAFILNGCLAACLLGTVYWFVRQFCGRNAAMAALLLFASVPIVGVTATSAGMDLSNLAMLALVASLAVLYLRVPGPDRLSLLVLATVLLSQCRYESVLFVAPVALVILAGWARAGRIVLSWPAVFSSLLFIPYAWHSRIIAGSRTQWDLKPGQTARFSTDYLSGNLGSAVRFFTDPSGALGNSWLLSLIGIFGLFSLAIVFVRKVRRNEGVSASEVVIALFAMGIVANLALLMFYYWSALDDPVAARFALPACLLFAWTAAYLQGFLEARGVRASCTLLVALGIWLACWGSSTLSNRRRFDQNPIMQKIDWEHAVIQSRPGTVLFVADFSPIPFILWHIPSIRNDARVDRWDQIRFQLQTGVFNEVLVAQSLDPSPDNSLAIDPGERIPARVHLEEIARERFGLRWVRISRISSIGPPTSPVR